jgi:pilus assembly protein TadC
MIKIPLSPLSPKLLEKISKSLLFFGNPISKVIPTLKTDLYQANFDIQPRDYVSACVAIAFFYFFAMLFLFAVLTVVIHTNLLEIGIPLSFMFLAFGFFSTLFYPKIIAMKRMRKLEANLVPALCHLLIEVRSGVPLFNAMAAISKGYGEVSAEFVKVVKSINTGISEIEALAEATRRNPSFQFRRALWQINNSIRAGSDIGNTLETIIADFRREQITAIKRYGQELNPWTMIYMVAAVIVPSLGITFLVVISAFSGMVIPKTIFPLIIFVLFGFQLFFMNFVKSKRPAV